MKILLITILIMKSFILYANNTDETSIILRNFAIQQDKNIDKKIAGDKTTMDLKLNKDSAVKIAEIILVHIYGNHVLEQRPWEITETETEFIIKGTLKRPLSDKNQKLILIGGVAEIVIRKSNACIIKYTHSK